MTGYILVAVIGLGIGIGVAILMKWQVAAGWSNKEFDGTMFIGVILLAFCGTLLGTFLKESFAGLETTQSAMTLFKDMFLVIIGYLFKQAVDAAKRTGGT